MAAGPNTAVSLLLPLVARYQREFPGSEVEFHAREAPELIRGVTDSTFDVVIGGLSRPTVSRNLLATHRLVLVPWVVDTWTLFGSPALAILARSRTLQALPQPLRVFHYPVVNQAHWAEHTTRYLNEALGVPVKLIEIESLELVRGAVINGLGFGIVPASATLVYGDDMMTVVRAIEPYGDLRLRLLHRRPRLLAPPVRDFVSFLVANRPRGRFQPQPYEGLFPLAGP